MSTFTIEASPVIALDQFISAAESEVNKAKGKGKRSSSQPVKSTAVVSESDSGLIDADKAAKAADRRASKVSSPSSAKGKEKTASAKAEPIKTEAIEVKAEPISESLPALPSNVTEIKPGVMIVRPSEASLKAEQKLDAEISTGFKEIAAKNTAKAEKKPREKGWTLPGGKIEPCQASELKATAKGSIMFTIIDLMTKGSTQKEFEDQGVGKGGNPFTYIREKKGYGCKKEGDRFFIVFPEGVSEPLYTLSKEEKKAEADKLKAEKKAKADAEKAAKAKAETKEVKPAS